MSGSFLEAGCPLVLGWFTFTLVPLPLKQLQGELVAWAREEPIRKARAAQALIESCRDILGADTDAEKRKAILSAVDQSLSPEWDLGGEMSSALIRSWRGKLKQIWMSARASAEKAGVSESEFAELLGEGENLLLALRVYLKVNGVDTKNPPAAAQPKQTGEGSTPPLQNASDTPPAKLGS